MPNKNDVVIIELDRPRELRFGHKAMKKILALTDSTVEDMEDGKTDLEGLEELEEILFFGLQRDARDNGETLTLEMMEDLLDEAESYEYVQQKIEEAFRNGMGRKSGNEPTPAAPKPNRATRRAKA